MLERIQGQPFSVKKRSDLESEREINLIKIDAAKHLEYQQYVLTLELETGPEDIIINEISPGELTILGTPVFAKHAGLSAEILSEKGIDLGTDDGEQYFEQQSENFQGELRSNTNLRRQYENDRMIAVCLGAIAEPTWINEQILRSWGSSVIEKIFEIATQGVVGQDAVNAFPSDDTGSTETSGDVDDASDM